jgi:photosystem II stability/assembly factor-like uncharacterized protein
MSTPDLESRLRTYYRTVVPDNSARLVMTSSRLLEDARRARPRRSILGTFRLAGTLVGAAIVLAVLVMARFNGGVTPGPVGGTGSPGPGFDSTAALRAGVDTAGAMRNGGLWAVQGSYLLTSIDSGATWRAGTYPSPSGVTAFATTYVLDQDHAWALTADRSTNGTKSPALPGTLSRTSDGGSTWQAAPVSADFECDTASLQFVDAQRGFLMCVVPSTPGPTGPTSISMSSATESSGTVLATTDGGITWSVTGTANGLSTSFVASDADTLWSVPDRVTNWKTGARLLVSRNGGANWSAVDLPGLSSLRNPGNTVDITLAAAPSFWDASNGTVAAGVFLNGTGTPPAIWFFRTADAGRTWMAVKKETDLPMLDFPPFAAVGRVWAARMSGNYNLAVSGDFGATWTSVPGLGMPDNTSFLSLDMFDANHGFATVFAASGTRCLMLTSDGGRSWHPADFGDARARLGSNSGDPVEAAQLAANYAVMGIKAPSIAWDILSDYSERVFGSEAAFEAAQTALGARTNYSYRLADPTQSAALLSLNNLGPGLWANLTSTADVTRAYVVVETFPGSTEPPESLVAAPIAATGEWRIWVEPVSPAATASPRIGRDEAIRLAKIASGETDPLVGTVELLADGGPLWPSRMVWSVQFHERAGASSGAAIVYVDAVTGEAKVVGRG